VRPAETVDEQHHRTVATEIGDVDRAVDIEHRALHEFIVRTGA
jgi:hypothetical protein